MITREQWGAAPPKDGCLTSRSLSDVDTAVIHYSDAAATPDATDDTVGDEHQAAAQVRGIQRFHMETRGWCDIGYHYLVALDGAVFEGRSTGAVGAHAEGHNRTTIGICVLTDGPASDEAKTAVRALVDGFNATAARGALRVVTHRSLDPTHCPGDE